MLMRLAFAVILLSAAYGIYLLLKCVMSDFDDDEAYMIGTSILITDVCAAFVLFALLLIFGGAE